MDLKDERQFKSTRKVVFASSLPPRTSVKLRWVLLLTAFELASRSRSRIMGKLKLNGRVLKGEVVVEIRTECISSAHQFLPITVSQVTGQHISNQRALCTHHILTSFSSTSSFNVDQLPNSNPSQNPPKLFQTLSD